MLWELLHLGLLDWTLFIKSTHPVDIHVAFWDDVSVKEGGFTRCGKRRGSKTTMVSTVGEKKAVICDLLSTFYLTCRETHSHYDFSLAGS